MCIFMILRCLEVTKKTTVKSGGDENVCALKNGALEWNSIIHLEPISLTNSGTDRLFGSRLAVAVVLDRHLGGNNNTRCKL